MKVRAAAVLFVVVLATCGFQIVRAATAASVTQPVSGDVDKAGRMAASRVGGEDQRTVIPSGGKWVGGNGVVEPSSRETKVAAQVTAVVQRVLVDEGAWVEQGQALVELSSSVELAAFQAAQAEVSAEQASFSRALKGLRIEDRDAVAAEAKAARSRAELVSGVLQRTEQLAKSGAATTDELDRARSQAQSEAAAASAIEARLRAAEAGSRREDIAFQRARFQAAEARQLQAKAQLERLTIRAPIAGEILQIKVRAGELYSFQGTEPLLVMGDTKTLRVRMDVDERDIAKVRLGSAAYAMADAFGQDRFAGKVVEIGRRFGRKNIRTDDPVEKNDTKVLEVVVQLDARDKLVVGQRVTTYVSE
jgi:HlyD family secretion protein